LRARKTKGNGSRRILIIVQNLPVPFDRRVWLECRTLTRAGYQVAVVCPKGKGDPSYQVIGGISGDRGLRGKSGHRRAGR